MVDINRSGPTDLVIKDEYLKKQYLQIQISEKQNQLKQLDVTLDKLKSVEIKKIEHAKSCLTKEIEALSTELKHSGAINVDKK